MQRSFWITVSRFACCNAILFVYQLIWITKRWFANLHSTSHRVRWLMYVHTIKNFLIFYLFKFKLFNVISHDSKVECIGKYKSIGMQNSIFLLYVYFVCKDFLKCTYEAYKKLLTTCISQKSFTMKKWSCAELAFFQYYFTETSSKSNDRALFFVPQRSDEIQTSPVWYAWIDQLHFSRHKCCCSQCRRKQPEWSWVQILQKAVH